MSASHLPPLISRDGVSTAWLQCAGAFVLFFNSWGIINTYGTGVKSLLKYIESDFWQASFRPSISRIYYVMFLPPTFPGLDQFKVFC